MTGYPLKNAFHAVALVIMTGYLLHVGRPILTPVVIAILIVFIVNGLAQLLRRLPRLGALPDWALEALAALALVAVLAELAGLVISSIGAFAGRAAAYQEALLAIYQSVARHFDFDEAATLAAIRAEAAQALNLPGLARSAALSALGVLGVLAFILLNAAFLIAERRTLTAKLGKLGLDPAALARLHAVLARINARVGEYLAVKTLMNLVLGLLSWGVMLAFGLEFAALFAIVIALLNYIPYLGSFIGVTFPAAAALVTFPDPSLVVWLVLWLAAAQLLIGNIVEPQVMGNSLNLSPWVILIALSVWGALWGVAGAVFSVPITAVMVVVFSEFRQTRAVATLLSKSGDVEARPA